MTLATQRLESRLLPRRKCDRTWIQALDYFRMRHRHAESLRRKPGKTGRPQGILGRNWNSASEVLAHPTCAAECSNGPHDSQPGWRQGISRLGS